MSSNSNQDDKNENNTEDSIKFINHNLEVLKLLRNKTLLQFVLLLMIFPKLSLSELSKLSKKSKGTVTHHLNKLEQLGALIVSREQSRGSIDAKLYELTPDYLKLKSYILKGLKNLKESNKIKLFNSYVRNDILIFEVIKKILDQTIQIYEEIEEFTKKSESLISFDTKNLEPDDLVNYDIWFLTEEEIVTYKEILFSFKSKIKQLLEKSQNNRSEKIKPYFILHAFFPLLNFTEKDTDKKPYKKFFKALD